MRILCDRSAGLARHTFAFAAIVLAAAASHAQSAGDYRSAATGPWSSASTWETFDGSNWIAASQAPAATDGAIAVRSPHVVSVTVPVTLDQATVEAGAALQVSAGIPVTVSNGAGTDLTIDGTLSNLGTISSAGATVAFSATGIYVHQYAVSAGAIPVASWDPSSRCTISGYTSNTTPPPNLTQNLGTVRWDCPGQTSAINLGGALTSMAGNLEVGSTGSGSLRLQGGGTFTINVASDLVVETGTLVLTSTNGSPVLQVGGDLKQSGGTIDLQLSGTGSSAELRVKGNVTLSAGSFVRGGASTPKLVMNGNTLQTYSSASPLGSGVFVDIASGASVQLATNLALASLTTLTVSGTLDGTANAILGHSLTVTNGGHCTLGTGGFTQLSAGTVAAQAGGILDVGAANIAMQSSISAAINVVGRLNITTGSISVATPAGTNPLNVSNGGILELGSGTITLGSGSATVFSGGTIRCGTGVLTAAGSASFSLLGGATLSTESADGIASSGLTGSIRTPSRSFATNARYLYNGAGPQFTGTGLPATVRALRVTGGGTVTLSANAAADSGVAVTSGTLVFDGRTLRSSTQLTVGATGRLQNTSTGTLTLGGGVANAGTVALDGDGVGCGGGDLILIRAVTPGLAQAWSGAGTFELTDVDAADQSGTVGVASGTNAGNTTGWIFGGCPTDVAGGAVASLALAPVTPNPVRQLAFLSFSLPRTGNVRLEVFDVAGHRVRALKFGTLRAGTHSQTLDTRGLSRGVYMARLSTPWGTLVRQLVVVR